VDDAETMGAENPTSNGSNADEAEVDPDPEAVAREQASQDTSMMGNLRRMSQLLVVNTHVRTRSS
jgi:hypothetical protein